MESNFSENVTILEKDDKTYYIIGTAHISERSVEEVRQVIDQVQPDTVCVELCETRYKTLMDEGQWKKLDIVQVIRQGKALLLLASFALSSFQKKMGDKLGVKPGSELEAGVKKAEEIGAKLVLADREVQVTLKRTWANLSFWKKMMVFSGLLESVFTNEEITKEDLEKMKEKDQLSEMMAEFAKVMPEVKKPLIDERDEYLMSRIEEADGRKIVAVVGAGHVEGMIGHFGKTIDRQAISEMPPPSWLGGFLKWAIPLLIIALFGYGIYQQQGRPISDLIYAWALPNIIGTAIFTLLGKPKLVTVIAASLAAPITSLNPAISAGMVAGLVEGWLRKPTVADCENIPEDIKTLKGFYSNRFTRVLLIFFLAQIGSVLGTLYGGTWLAMIITG